MKGVFETAECEAVRNSIFMVQRYEKQILPTLMVVRQAVLVGSDPIYPISKKVFSGKLT